MATGSASPEPSAGTDRGRVPPGAAAVPPPPPQRAPSLRRRLAATFAVLVLLVAIGQAFALYWTTEHAEEALIDRVLEEQLRRSVAAYRTDPRFAFPNTGDMTLYVIGPGETGTLPAWLRTLPAEPGRHELHPSPELEVHVAVLREADRVFYLVYDVADHEQRQRDTAAMLALSVLAAGALGLLFAHALAGRLLADLERLAAAVRGRGEGARRTSDGALAPLARHAETLTLARVIDEEQARAHEALERERAFAAAANHELRTPLMQASSTLELLDAKLADPADRTLIRRLQTAHDELRALTGALLRVARGRVDEALAPCALAEITAVVIARAQVDASARAIVLVNQVPQGVRARVDAGSLTIVLQNLLRNAIRHSGGTRVTVGFDEGWLSVDDDGRGLGQRDRAREASGSGIGLAIVDRVCDANGWNWTLAAGPQGGTSARVCLGLQDGGSVIGQ